MTAGDVTGDKLYFVEMIDEVRSKLARLAADSPINRCFSQSRLDAISAKIPANTIEELEWDHCHSPASLCNWLLLKRKQTKTISSSFDELLAALASVSGILVFDGCKLGAARINYNADSTHMISHAEMAIVERILSVSPLYAQ